MPRPASAGRQATASLTLFLVGSHRWRASAAQQLNTRVAKSAQEATHESVSVCATARLRHCPPCSRSIRAGLPPLQAPSGAARVGAAQAFEARGTGGRGDVRINQGLVFVSWGEKTHGRRCGFMRLTAHRRLRAHCRSWLYSRWQYHFHIPHTNTTRL